MTKKIINLTSILISSCAVFAAEPVESDFFTDTIGSVDQTVNLVTDYGANGADTNDDSLALQNAIAAMTALPNGGEIVIPAGTFYFNLIEIKSNVHLVFDTGATLKTASTVTDSNHGMFYFGAKTGIAEVTPVQNSSIRCAQGGSGGRFTVDFTGAINTNIFVVNSTSGDNFMIADFNLIDNQTKFNAVTVNTARHDDGSGVVYSMSKNGLIKNITCSNQRYGYGVIQMKSGTNILIKNLDGEGGATVRLESGGDAYLDPPQYVMNEIYVRDIVGRQAKGAVMLSPHTRNNGKIDVARVIGIACGYTVDVSGGFVANGELGVGAGTFADTTIISDVHGIFGLDAQFKPKDFDLIPCAIRSQLSGTLNPDGSSYNGPAAVCIYYPADTTDALGDDAGDYIVTFRNVTHEGFDHQYKLIINEDDQVSSCNAVPVNGISVTPESATVAVNGSVQLTATMTPANATQTTEVWSSDTPSVATVNTSGLVTAVSEGTATISVIPADGSYIANTVITVTGPYAAWATTHASGAAIDGDHDLDGVKNGIEYFMGEVGSSFTSLPVPDAANTITWPKSGTFTGVYGTDYYLESSTPDLSSWLEVLAGNVTINSGSIVYTMPSGSDPFFVRLVVHED
ncbi:MULTISPECIES: Ig-like domain-containing protein [unclassified Lentimonas]|uniref:Ig-like domain-containing protein n=1 Tax=unclassified Lentimonas TaxID=2630993 RepID=UPI001389B433|nr:MULTISPECIES: Ig-like domain-containing protein [unclassified Lentimonas]